MSSRFSVLIPVYRESEFLEPLLDKLAADPYENKEVIVVVDEPTEKSLGLAGKYLGKVRFIWNGERKGKANVLNDVVEQSTGDILFFLDSDIILDGNAESLFESIRGEIEDAEIVEVKKEVIRDSFLARIVSYDYMGFNFTNWFFSKRLNRCVGLNGAAFAVKRETFMALGGFRKVIMEDLDIGIRSFIKGVRYRFAKNTRIYVKAPSSWTAWFRQRKRWAMGSALWFKEYFRDFVRIAKAHPGVLLPALLFVFPTLPFFLATFLTPDDVYFKTFYVSLLLLSTQASLLLPPTSFTSTSLVIFRNIFLMVGSIGAYSLVFYLLARKMGCSFNLLEFALFYLVYSPLWLLIIIANLGKVCLGQKTSNIDWKI
jgi:biofilm PGA synthesis N-glycosyltransferase PgaC